MNSFARRVLAEQWIEKSERERKGKYRYDGGNELPEGTFTQPVAQMVQTLKTKSKDYAQAMARLNSFINMNGKNLGLDRKRELERAKDALKRAYGVQE